MNEIAHLYFIFFYSHFRSLLETITLCLVSSKNGQGINRFWCELRVLASIFCQFWFALDSRGWNGFLQNLAFDLCDQIAWGCLWLDDISTHKHDDNWTRKRAELNTNNTCLRCKSSFLFLTEINFFFSILSTWNFLKIFHFCFAVEYFDDVRFCRLWFSVMWHEIFFSCRSFVSDQPNCRKTETQDSSSNPKLNLPKHICVLRRLLCAMSVVDVSCAAH